MGDITSYEDALRYLYGFTDYERSKTRKRDDFRLEGIRQLLRLLDNPQDRMGNIIHVAGSKGKGSTSAMLANVLRESGYKTGLYTSPHLNTHRERYRINGTPISETAFTHAIQELRPAIETALKDHILTTFDIITTIAFWWFAQERADWSVVEVGLGGRLDSTNVVTPEISVITSISLDHTETLGNSLALIAREKSGIIKPGKPSVANCPQPEPRQVIIEQARRQNSKLLLVDEQAAFRERRSHGGLDQSFIYTGPLWLQEKPLDGQRLTLSLAGAHQIQNALTTLTTLSELGEQAPSLTLDSLRAGFASVQWPGRLEMVERGRPILLDGAHNPESIARLRSAVCEMFPNASVTCVIGSRIGHDYGEMLAQLQDWRLVLCPSSHPRTTPVEELAEYATAAGLDFSVAANVPNALDRARRDSATDLIVVCGSLFVVADAREALGIAEALDPVRS